MLIQLACCGAPYTSTLGVRHGAQSIPIGKIAIGGVPRMHACELRRVYTGSTNVLGP